MISLLAGLLVLLAGLYLAGLGAVALVAPARAGRFLGSFARSASAHYAELLLRLVAGGALVAYAPRMRFSAVFTPAGWVLVATTAALFAVPWQWHRRFAQWSVPRARNHVRLLGLASLLLGGFVLVCMIPGDRGGAAWRGSAAPPATYRVGDVLANLPPGAGHWGRRDRQRSSTRP